jgi:hypothetical protein
MKKAGLRGPAFVMSVVSSVMDDDHDDRREQPDERRHPEPEEGSFGHARLSGRVIEIGLFHALADERFAERLDTIDENVQGPFVRDKHEPPEREQQKRAHRPGVNVSHKREILAVKKRSDEENDTDHHPQQGEKQKVVFHEFAHTA